MPATIPAIPDERICFWGGWGGFVIMMDLGRQLTFSYMMNAMSPGVVGSPRSDAYLNAVYQALGR